MEMMIYRTKYLAMEAASAYEVAVKVEGGYILMEARERRMWKRK